MKSKKKYVVLIILLGLALILSACSIPPKEKMWLKSSGWSRAVLLGDTFLSAPAEVVVDSSGKIYSVLYPRSTSDDTLFEPELVVVDPTGTQIQIHPLDIQIRIPKQYKLILLNERLILFWIESKQLKSIELSPEGELLSDELILSGEEQVYNLDLAYSGEEFQVWYAGSRDDPGLYLLSGIYPDLERTLVDPLGTRVEIFQDKNEQLHVSWVHYPRGYGTFEIHFLKSGFDQVDFSNSILLFTKRYSPSLRFDGPVVGMDEELVYLIWSEAVVSGLEAGARTTYYMYFPHDRPDIIRPPFQATFPASQLEDQEEFYGGSFQTGPRVHPGGLYRRTGSIYDVFPLEIQEGEQALVFRSGSEYKWRDFKNQVNVGYFSNGMVTSYQPLSYTAAESTNPSIASDQELNLYVTWLEKEISGYGVYLSTTDPVKKTSFDVVENKDYLFLVGEGLFELLAGLVLAPFAAAVWGGLGLVGFVFNLVLSNLHKKIFRVLGEALSIISGITIFWWLKFATLPGLDGDFVPFSAWIPRLPKSWEGPLIIAVPILIGLIAFSTAFINTYGKKKGSAINFHLIYSAVDAALSCSIYGILIYGAF